MVFVACLSGHGNQPPSDSDIEKGLQKMEDAVKKGADLSAFMAFTKQGEPVQF